MHEFQVGTRLVGPGQPTYVIAELSANHGGRFDRAVELLRRSAAAGADAVKVQTYRPDSMTLDASDGPFRLSGGTLWDGRTLFDLYAEAQTPWEWHADLQREAVAAGVDFFASAFDAAAVSFLTDLDVPLIKIASFELIDHSLIGAAAASGKPLILSTGMASVEEIDEAIVVARDAGATMISLLRCNSAYPAPSGEMDLRTIPDMAARWNIPIGLSDHTRGGAAAIAAVALGANMVEKHITLSRAEHTPDAEFSLEPDEFQAMVEAVREAEASLGGVRYGPSDHERVSLSFRRSLFVVADIEAGELFTNDNLRSIRPSDGLAPRYLDAILGQRAATRIRRGTAMDWSLVG